MIVCEVRESSCGKRGRPSCDTAPVLCMTEVGCSDFGLGEPGLPGIETPDNPIPPPKAFVSAMSAETEGLIVQPDVAASLSKINSRLPPMLGRFDRFGGLWSIYESVRCASADSP
jgi:hypothetical protein